MGAAPPWLEVAAALLDALAEPAWLADASTWRVCAANAAAEAWLGVPRSALCGRSVLDMAVTPEDLAFWAEAQADGSPEAARLDSETFARAAGGALQPVRRRVRHVGFGAGSGAFIVQWVDLAERRRSEGAQAERLAELTATLEATADGILVTALDGSVVNFNRRFAELWQLPEELHRRRQDGEVLTWLQRSMAAPAAYMRRLATVDEAGVEETHDTLRLRSGRQIERIGRPRQIDGVTVGRVWSFREQAAAA